MWLVNPSNPGPVRHILSGGLMLGAVFMATDCVTTPVTRSGKWIFSTGCGIILMLLRIKGGPAKE